MSEIIDLKPCAAHLISVHYSDPDFKASTDKQKELCDVLWTRYNYHHKLVKALQLAIDFIDKHPADPDISAEQTEAWIKLQNFDPHKLLKELSEQ